MECYLIGWMFPLKCPGDDKRSLSPSRVSSKHKNIWKPDQKRQACYATSIKRNTVGGPICCFCKEA